MLTNNVIYGRNATLETLNTYSESYKLIETLLSYKNNKPSYKSCCIVLKRSISLTVGYRIITVKHDVYGRNKKEAKKKKNIPIKSKTEQKPFEQ